MEKKTGGLHAVIKLVWENELADGAGVLQAKKGSPLPEHYILCYYSLEQNKRTMV